MVGLSTVLMVGLGIWVMKVANEATEVSKISVRGTPCPRIPEIVDRADDAPLPPMNLDAPATPSTDAPPSGPSPSPSPSADGSAAPVEPAGSAAPKEPAKADEPDRPRSKVQLDPSEITIMQPAAKPRVVPPDLGQKVLAHWTCELRLGARLDVLEHGRLRILWVMIATGLLLVLGLAAYGIKMTHKVAGPLFKVGLYLGKMRQGRFDKVYNLRKGDQLVEFYDHFKLAHAGVVKMQEDDIERLKTVIAAADAAGAGEDPAVGQLRELLARKEKSIE
jgi:hypothetical protein